MIFCQPALLAILFGLVALVVSGVTRGGKFSGSDTASKQECFRMNVNQYPDPRGAAVNVPAIITNMNADTGPGASPASFGFSMAGLIPGLNAVAGVTGDIAQDRIKKESDLWVSQQSIEAEKNWTKKLSDHLATTGQAYDPDRFDADFQADMDRRADLAPNDQAREGFRHVASNMALGFFKQNLGAARSILAEQQRVRLAMSYQDLVLNPNMSFEEGLQAIEEQTRIADGIVPGAGGMANEARVQLEQNEAQRIARTQGPDIAATAIRSGRLGTNFTPVQRENAASSLDNQAKDQVGSWKSTSESEAEEIENQIRRGENVSPEKRNAVARNAAIAEDADIYQDAKRPTLATLFREQQEAFDKSMVNSSGRYAMEEFQLKKKFQILDSERLIATRFAGASPKERETDLRDLKAMGTPLGKHLYSIAENIDKDISEKNKPGPKFDPAGYALTLPHIQAAMSTGYSKLGEVSILPESPEKAKLQEEAGRAFERAVEMSFNAQRRQGRPQGQERILTSEQAADFAGTINRLTGEQKIAQIKSLGSFYGKYAERVFEDINVLAPAGQKLGLGSQYAMAVRSDSPSSFYIAKGLESPQQNADSVAKGLPQQYETLKEKDWSAALDGSATWHAFLKSSQGSAADFVLEHEQMVRQFAQNYLAQGFASTPEDAVNLAINSTVGEVNLFAGSIRIPRESKSGQIRTQKDAVALADALDGVKNEVISKGIAVPGENLEQMFANEPDEVRRRKLMQERAVLGWMTVPNGQGAQLMSGEIGMDGQFIPLRPMIQKSNGEAMIIDFDKPPKLEGAYSPMFGEFGEAPTPGEWVYEFRKTDVPLKRMDRPQPAAPGEKTAPARPLESRLPDKLKPYAESFHSLGEQYGVDPALLAAISIHETGGGTSKAFKNKNNLMGVSDKVGPISFADPVQSIERIARLLGQGSRYQRYRDTGDLNVLGSIYAPVGAGNDPSGLNKHWAGGVGKHFRKLKGQS